MATDTSERGLERLICTAMTGAPCDPVPKKTGNLDRLRDTAGGTGWICGDPHDYDREYCVDLFQLASFLRATQSDVADSLDLENDGPTRRKFLDRLQGEVSKRGTVDVLRNGIKHGPHHFDLFYGTPSIGNIAAAERHALNGFSVTRQLRYSRDETQLSLDLALFLNGLPIATMELKNSLTKQTVADAVAQYGKREHRERLFEFGRCLVHFAVDDNEVKFCTHLKGRASWFLPFNRGWNDGAGNPPNPAGLKTAYLWKEILSRQTLILIIENYSQIVEYKDKKTQKKKREQIWPRYHQLDVVRKLLAAAQQEGAGKRYLIQHSAGSGKSNSIAWLAHQLIGLTKDDVPVFDSIVVVTDRRLLDEQIRDTIGQFAQVGATLGIVTGKSGSKGKDLRGFLNSGKKIIITTVQTFPGVAKILGSEHQGRKFAIIIDEAHSGQGGRTSAAVSMALGDSASSDVETTEDRINRLMESKKMLTNASYFAFTATPKNKTLEIFGVPEPTDEGGKRHRPFHSYTMKQAIQEGFILDVLESYTPVNSYYRLTKTVPGDPEFDVKRARKKLRRYVESHEHAIRLKAEIMVDHFLEQVVALDKIGGKARAMVVTNGIERAIQYYHAISDYLNELKSHHRAIIAFSGEHEFAGKKVTESSLNGFGSGQIASKIQEEPYRFLICADKFQTGYDEPLLQSMYVDKPLSGIKAVQTLSRLNRAHPEKDRVFVLDFMNDVDIIQDSFAAYYRTTILSAGTDENTLHDLKAALDRRQVYSPDSVNEFVERYLNGDDRDSLEPILNDCVVVYQSDLDEDAQVEFKGKAKAFLRTYGFLSSILPYTNSEWERLSIFLTFLVRKLPAPFEEDLARGILDAIDMDSYRAEKQAVLRVQLPDQDATIDPMRIPGGGHKPESEMERLSNIIKGFNQQFGNIKWQDGDRIHKLLTEEIPAKVAADPAYQNAQKNSDKGNARVEHDKALLKVVNKLFQDDTEFFRQFMDNESFQRGVRDTVFKITYRNGAA